MKTLQGLLYSLLGGHNRGSRGSSPGKECTRSCFCIKLTSRSQAKATRVYIQTRCYILCLSLANTPHLRVLGSPVFFKSSRGDQFDMLKPLHAEYVQAQGGREVAEELCGSRGDRVCDFSPQHWTGDCSAPMSTRGTDSTVPSTAYTRTYLGEAAAQEQHRTSALPRYID